MLRWGLHRATRPVGAALLLVDLAACPIQVVPRDAVATKGFKACWQPDEQSEDPIQKGLTAALGARLQAAGYVLVPTGCDFRLSWNVERQWHNAGGPGWYKNVTLNLRTPLGQPIDKVFLEFLQGQVPAEEPDRLAVLMVNAINDSTRLAATPRRPWVALPIAPGVTVTVPPPPEAVGTAPPVR